MAKRSAGVVLYRFREKELQVLLLHMGGPFWKNKDEGGWTIPKGEYEGEEPPLEAAKREFIEETGFELPEGPWQELPEIRQAGGKRVQAYAVEGNCDPEQLSSNTFEMEWPPRSGRRQSFPEADRAGWFSLAEARRKMIKSQAAVLDHLKEAVQ